jgi:2-polyprenyl-3-methyl-5-hydroxy-6-metoxy-1,4-benzoquinol methylase
VRILANRDRQPEVMDQPGLDAQLHHQALEGLRRSNRISRTAQSLWNGLEATGVLRCKGQRDRVRVLDLACGGGDVAIGLASMAQRAEVPLTVHGCDRSELAVAHAQAAAERAGVSSVKFFPLDVLHDPLPDDYDAILCTLFLHHLAEADCIALLERIAAATGHTLLVDDLIRSRMGFALVWLGTHLLTSSPVVHVDGPLSVRAAFDLTEVRTMAARAGLHGATIHRHWPERFTLSWSKS